MHFEHPEYEKFIVMLIYDCCVGQLDDNANARFLWV
jgi:hypothetical protein